ncbi:translocation/assembly module TamB domain-containing protein [Chthonobacter rhizosphaerae]|uniref:translocation/assembly module TamB domain-containing protein n=1 Tax=Chthonobacter rhizosphaerae TaxID=2735553 RepID=UPI0015EF9058|nr:translocation/assembly module TamB domain-containing protein [Chthonobacter rhizosphaerae]
MTLVARIAALAFLLAVSAVGAVLVGPADGLLIGVVGAQEDDTEEKSRFVRFVEDQISTPDRRISIGPIDGVLSSDARIAYIAVSDREGEWLRIENVHLVWSRLALLRGRLDIDLLEAERITLARSPVPAETPDPAAGAGFQLPDLPVEIVIDRLTVPAVSLAESFLGQPAVLSVDGAISLEGGALDTNLAIVRTDGPGGRFALRAAYANETNVLDLDFSLDEPANGVVATLLNIPNRPALAFRIAGSGPLDGFAADITLAANGEQLLSGRTTLTGVEGGRRFVTDVTGNLAPLIPAEYADYVRGSSTLAIDAVRADTGALTLDRLDLTSGVLSFRANGALAPDGFPTRLAIDGRVGAEGQEAVVIPGAAGQIANGRFQVSFGGEAEEWTAAFDVTGFRSGGFTAGRALIEARGVARNLQDAATRSLTFDVGGGLTGITSDDPAIARAVGEAVDLAARGTWTAGQPVEVETARVANANAEASFVGRVEPDGFNGRYTLRAADLAAFSGVAGQDLAGSADLAATGTVALIGGGFDLTLDGTGTELRVGIPAADSLLEGETVVGGRAVRDTAGLRFDNLRVANRQAEIHLDGAYDFAAADLRLTARLANIARVAPRASGPVAFEARLTGSGQRPNVVAVVMADALDLAGKPLTNAEARFEGVLDGALVNGDLTVTGRLADVPLDLRARIASLEDGVRRLEDLAASVGTTRATGDVALTPDGLATGSITFTSPDISVVAPLALVDGSGAVDAAVTLSAEGGRQSAVVRATARDLTVETVTIGTAAVDATLDDLFGRPVIDGRAEAARVAVGGVTIDTLTATAARSATGDAFEVTADARLNGGRVQANGTVGETLNLTADIASLPLALANAFAPDLGASGTLSGRAEVTGTVAAPEVSFRAEGRGLTANALQAAGVDPLTLNADGRFAENTVTFDATVGGGGGIDLTVSGTVPLAGDGLSVSATGTAPLAIANQALATRGTRVTGTARLDVRVTGSIDAPAVAGTVTVDGATLVDPETQNRLTGIAATVRFDGDEATIERLTAATPRGGRITGSGTVGLTGDQPVDLTLTAASARYTYGELVRGEASGTVTLTGAIAGTLTLGGRIVLDRTEVTVPERLPSSATLLDVKHRLPPPNVRRTLERARLTTETRRAAERAGVGGGGLVLDLTVEAPARLFVRGRGLDAELFGSVRLTGPVNAIEPVGSFEMRRGRLDIIGQRITFDRGSITLVGDLDPLIDFSATTRTNQISVTASVTGQVSNPQIVLSSTPELPQDEILAQFLFGRSLDELSPFQIARLATAVAQFSGGGGGPDLLGRLRASTGLDDLDVVTDESGNAAVQAGRYIGENIYVGVTAGAGGQTRLSVNLDITDEVKARAEVGADAGSRVGVYYEKEY